MDEKSGDFLEEAPLVSFSAVRSARAEETARENSVDSANSV
jgi:hypothetical protein